MTPLPITREAIEAGERLDATLAELARPLKWTIDTEGKWHVAPAPQSDADWIRQHINTGKSK